MQKGILGDIPKISLLLIVVLFISFAKKGQAEVLSIQGERVTLRNGPDQKAKPLWEYGNGFPLEVLKKQGEWLMVKDFENDSGWIHRSRLQKGQQVIVKANKDENKPINIRNGPSTNNAIIANAYYGVVFSVLRKKGTMDSGPP